MLKPATGALFVSVYLFCHLFIGESLGAVDPASSETHFSVESQSRKGIEEEATLKSFNRERGEQRKLYPISGFSLPEEKESPLHHGDIEYELRKLTDASTSQFKTYVDGDDGNENSTISLTINGTGPQTQTHIITLHDEMGQEQSLDGLTVIGNQEWINATKVAPDESVQLTVDATNLLPGWYEGKVVFVSPGSTQIKGMLEVKLNRKTPMLEVFPKRVDQVISPGRNSSFSVILFNTGNEPMNSVQMILSGDTTSDIAIREDLSFIRNHQVVSVERPAISSAADADVELNSIYPNEFASVTFDVYFWSKPRGSNRLDIQVKTEIQFNQRKGAEIPVNLDVSTMQICPANIDSTISASGVRSFTNLPFTLINLESTGPIELELNKSTLPSFINLPYVPERLLPSVPTVLTALTSYNLDNYPTPGTYVDEVDFNAITSKNSEVRELEVDIAAVAGKPDPYKSKALAPPDREVPVNKPVHIEILLNDSMGNKISEAALEQAGYDGLSFLTIWKQYEAGGIELITSLNYDGNQLAYGNVEATKLGRVEIHMVINGVPIGNSPVLFIATEALCDIAHEQRTQDSLGCECEPGYWRHRISGECRPCAAGFFKGPKDEKCSICPADTFSLPGSSTCNTCPEKAATCTEGIIRISPGYWWNPKYDVSEVDDDTLFHECPNPEACKVKNNSVTCSKGHTGVLCGVCEEGYAAQGNVCAECTDGMTYFAALGSFGFILLALMVMRTKEFADSNAAGIFRIFVSWAQVTALVGTLSINNSASVRTSLTLGHMVSGMSFDFQPMRCLTGFNLFERTYAYFTMPLVVILLSMIFGWVTYVLRSNHKSTPLSGILCPCAHKYQKKVRKALRSAKQNNKMYADPTVQQLRLWQQIVREIKGSVSVILYLIYFPLLWGLISVWDKYKYKIDGKTYLNQDLRMTDSHSEYAQASALSIIGLILYAIILPFIALRAIWRHRFSLTSPRLRAAWGFLYEGCRLTEARYLWEFFVLLRKFTLVLIATLVSDPLLQAGCFFYVLVLSLALHLAVKPYKSTLMEALEALGLGIQCMSVLSMVAVSSTKKTSLDTLVTNEQAEEGAAAGIILTNCVVAIVQGIAFFAAFSSNVKGYVKAWNQTFTRFCCENCASWLCRGQYRKYIRDQQRRRKEVQPGDFSVGSEERSSKANYIANPLAAEDSQDVESKSGQESKFQANDRQTQRSAGNSNRNTSDNPLSQYVNRQQVQGKSGKRGVKPMKTAYSPKS